MDRYIDAFRAIGDETRLRLLRVLVEAGTPLCLAELVDIVRRPQYAVSRAMAQLGRAALVEVERRGTLRSYRLAGDPFTNHLIRAVQSVPGDDSHWMNDRDRLRWRLDLRHEGRCVITYTAGYAPREYMSGDETTQPDPSPRVLFVCVHNTARSQMAEAYLRRFAGDRFDVESAGLEPGVLNPIAVRAMADDGIDISQKVPRSVTDTYRAGRTFSHVIAVCSRAAERNCPAFPCPVRRLNWPFPDPARFTGTEDERLAKTIAVRDAIREKVRGFVRTAKSEEESNEQQTKSSGDLHPQQRAQPDDRGVHPPGGR